MSELVQGGALVVGVLLLAYLVVALLRPEDF